MAHINDYLVDQVKNAFVVNASATNNTATATKLAVPGSHHVVRQVDASFSSSTASALLQIKYGSDVVAEKYIHGAGALDFGADLGLENPDVNEDVSAVLAAGGVGVTGKVVLTGFTTGHSS